MKKPEIRFKGFTDDWKREELNAIASYCTSSLTASDCDEAGKHDLYDANGVIGKTDINVQNEDYITIIKDGSGVGRVRMLPADSSFIGTMGAIKPKESDLDFLYALLEGMDFSTHIIGGTIPHIYFSDYGNDDVCVPSFPEQMQIGQLFKSLDQLNRLYQTKCDMLISFKKGLLEKMLPYRNADVPEIRFKGYNNVWKHRKLSSVIDIHSGKDYKHLSAGSIPVYGTGGYMLSVDEALSNLDAIGIGRKGTINNPYILKAPFWTVDTLFFAIPKKGYDLNFIYDVFQSIDWTLKDESTGVPSLSKNAIYDTTIMITSYDEQIKIGRLFSQLDKAIALHQQKIDSLVNVKHILLDRMFI